MHSSSSSSNAERGEEETKRPAEHLPKRVPRAKIAIKRAKESVGDLRFEKGRRGFSGRGKQEARVKKTNKNKTKQNKTKKQKRACWRWRTTGDSLGEGGAATGRKKHNPGGHTTTMTKKKMDVKVSVLLLNGWFEKESKQRGG